LFSENGKAVGVEYKRALVQKFSQIASSLEPWELLDQHMMEVRFISFLVFIFKKNYDQCPNVHIYLNAIIHRVTPFGRNEDVQLTVLPYLEKALESGNEKLVEVARRLLFLRFYYWTSNLRRQEIEKLSNECKTFSDLYERVLKADSEIALFNCYMEVNNWANPSRYLAFKIYIIDKYREIHSTPIPLSILKLAEKTSDLKPLIFRYVVTNSNDYCSSNLMEILNTLNFQSCSLMGVRDILTNIIVKEFSIIGVDKNLIFLMTNLITMVDIEIINLKHKQNLIKQ
jgi:hypothetical protein